MTLTGVETIKLASHVDHRGDVTEVHRTSRSGTFRQWNVARSNAGVLRGVHCHLVHDDYLTILDGQMVLGLHDLRRDSPTFGRGDAIVLRPLDTAVFVPAGVAHGFWFTVPTTLVYGVSAEWDPSDELGCHWTDPELRIPWNVVDPALSRRDEHAGSLASLQLLIDAAWDQSDARAAVGGVGPVDLRNVGRAENEPAAT